MKASPAVGRKRLGVDTFQQRHSAPIVKGGLRRNNWQQRIQRRGHPQRNQGIDNGSEAISASTPSAALQEIRDMESDDDAPAHSLSAADGTDGDADSVGSEHHPRAEEATDINHLTLDDPPADEEEALPIASLVEVADDDAMNHHRPPVHARLVDPGDAERRATQHEKERRCKIVGCTCIFVGVSSLGHLVGGWFGNQASE
jgi:hypothetical protein